VLTEIINDSNLDFGLGCRRKFKRMFPLIVVGFFVNLRLTRRRGEFSRSSVTSGAGARGKYFGTRFEDEAMSSRTTKKALRNSLLRKAF
jgi:hypothetical protein